MNETNLEIKGMRKNMAYIFIIMLIAIVMSSIVSYVTEVNNIDKGVVTDFSNEWRNDLGTVADLNQIAEYRYIEKEIPEISSDCMLFFKTNNVNVEVFKNDVCVLSASRSRGKLVGKTNGKELLEIPIYTGDSGSTIRIDIYVPYKGNASISDIYIGNELTYVREYIKDNILNFIVCSSMVIIGALQILLFIGGRKQGISVSMLFLGLFSLLVGIFLLIDSRFLQYAIGHSGSLHVMSEMVMSILAIPLLYFIRYHSVEVYEKEKFFGFVVVYQYVSAAVLFTLNLFEIFDYHQTIFMCHIGYILTGVYTFVKVKQEMADMSNYQLIHIVALLCMMLGGLADIIFYYVSNYSVTTSFLVIGTLLFTVIEMTGLVNGYIIEYKNRMLSDLENHLTFHDGLTDLYTKTTYTEEIKKLSKQNTSRVIALIRVTGVSKINEEYGYRVGDEIIIYASQKLQKKFADYGRSYRLGGNEMIFISEDGVSLEMMKDEVLKLKSELLLPNDIIDEPIVIAYGVTLWDSKERSYDKAFDDIVKIMFDHKRSLEL